MEHKTDEQLQQLLANDSSKDVGFTLLVDQYKERIYWYIKRMVVSHEDAQDVMQNTFFNVYKYVHQFKGKCKLSTWVYQIATNESIKLIKSKRSFFISSDTLQLKMIDLLHDEALQDADSILMLFNEAVLLLPEKQQIVFNLRYYEALSYDEISLICNASVGSLKTNYHYAVEKVKLYIKQHQL